MFVWQKFISRKSFCVRITIMMCVLALVYTSGCKQRIGDQVDKNTHALSDFRQQETRASTLSDPFKIEIAAIGPSKRARISFKVTVTNTSIDPCGWDSLFSVFLTWRVFSDSKEFQLEPVTVVRRIKHESKSLSKSRFMLIKPGASISRTVVLTKPFREFLVEPLDSSGGRHPAQFRAFERLAQYKIDKKTHSLSITMEYIGNWEAPKGFQSMFGFTPTSVKLVTRQIRSNTVTLTFRK